MTPGIPSSADSPTWRDALIAAWQGIEDAHERRREVVQEAHDAGLSFRQIADAVGSSAMTVHRIIGNQGHRRDALLDRAAS